MFSKKNLMIFFSLTVFFPVLYLFKANFIPQEEQLVSVNFRFNFGQEDQQVISSVMDEASLRELGFFSLKKLQQSDKNFVSLNFRTQTITYLGKESDLTNLLQTDFINVARNEISPFYKAYKEKTKKTNLKNIKYAKKRIKDLQSLTLDNNLVLEDAVLQEIKKNIIESKVAILLATQKLKWLDGQNPSQINLDEQMIAVEFFNVKIIKQQNIPLKILFYAFLGAGFSLIIILTEKLFFRQKN